MSLRVACIARVTSYDLFLLHELRVIFAYELRDTVYCTNYELLYPYELRVTVYSMRYELLLLPKLRVTVYCPGYELLFIVRVTSYFLHTSYELMFFARVTSYILTMISDKDRDDEVVYNNKIMIKNYSLKSFFDKELGVR